MLVLFETAAGPALFKIKDESRISENVDLFEFFATAEGANDFVKLHGFSKYENTVAALSGTTAIVEGKLSKDLKEFLEREVSAAKETLVVSDPKLGGAIAKKLGIKVLSDSSTQEIYRGIRSQLDNLLTGLSGSDLSAMQLGLSHSLSRYKIKFSPDKVDTMIVQAVALLDDLDKDLNTYAMRCKEWYGWHFPEMAKIIVDNLVFAKVVRAVGMRTNMSSTDLSHILPEELETELKEAAEISMGTEISEEDIMNINYLCDQIISLTTFRSELYEYLQNRMRTIAPNLTALLGELVGARLISHAGSLMTLAKYPASTVQLLGAEKALFRAMKTKQDTPKYGLLFHATLVGQAPPKLKGKMARMLATKTSLSARVDALGENASSDLGTSQRFILEERLRILESNPNSRAFPTYKAPKKFEMVKVTTYNTATDSTIPSEGNKRTIEEVASPDEKPSSPKKAKKEKKDKKDKEGKKKEKKEKKEKGVELATQGAEKDNEEIVKETSAPQEIEKVKSENKPESTSQKTEKKKKKKKKSKD
ncbi:Nucleolar protein 58 [Massospora cicadina]|nr:Nucleolar protein 58 [Massospora cicadina]